MSTDKKSTETNNACETGMGTAVASFLLGATAGVAAGIILAPRAAELAGEVKASASDMARRGAKKGHEVVNDTANSLHMAGAALRDRASRRKRGWRCASAFWGTGIRAI
ncbi:MAG: YtxH domain-containing protein [Acidobacteriia bacterium]|nr:YtxH domain-containing protein [Terriglobia bacterium]